MSRKNGAGDSGFVAQHQRTLTEVAQRAGGQDEAEPAAGDGAATEVPHVGVERLGAGDREHDRGKGEERDVEVAGQERQRVGRRQRLEDLRVVDDRRSTPHAPMATNHTIITGPKNRPTAAVPCRCTANSATMITAVIGTTEILEVGVDDLEPLDRREHRDRRGDHAVAEEQRRAEDAQRGQGHRGPAVAGLTATAAAA